MKTSFTPWATTNRRDAHTVRSPDDSIAVTVARVAEGVYVERVVHRPGRARVVQASVFNSAQSFRRWCDADAIRFECPLVAQGLIRHADELFSDAAIAGNAG